MPYDYAQFFRVEFTASAIFRRSNLPLQLSSVQESIDECELKRRRISYYSSWTIEPSVRADREIMETTKEIFAGLTAHHHHAQGITDLLGLGLPKFNTDKFFMNWGFERSRLRGEPVPNAPLDFLGNIDCVLMHMRDFNSYAKDMALKFNRMWQNRIIVGAEFRPNPGQVEKDQRVA